LILTQAHVFLCKGLLKTVLLLWCAPLVYGKVRLILLDISRLASEHF
jgi:hypothetical protein